MQPQLANLAPGCHLAKLNSDLRLQSLLLFLQNSCCQLDCSPSLPTEPQLRLEAAKSTTGKLIVVVLHVHVPHTIISIGNEAISQLLLARF